MPVRSYFCVVVSPLVITQKKTTGGSSSFPALIKQKKKGEKCKKEMNEHSTLPAEHLCWSDMKQSNDCFP